MRLIDRLDRQQHDPEDGPQNSLFGQSASEPDEPLHEESPQAGADATRAREQSRLPDLGVNPTSPFPAEPAMNGDRQEVAPSDEVAFARGNGFRDRPAADLAAEAGSPRRSRPAASSGGPRPLKEGLRKGLGEERVWLQAQREELETERSAIHAEIEAEIEDIDAQIGHIDALLGSKPDDPAEGANIWDPPSSIPAQLHRTG